MKKDILMVLFLAVSPLVWAQPQPMSDRQTAEKGVSREELRKTVNDGTKEVKRSLSKLEEKIEAQRIASENAAAAKKVEEDAKATARQKSIDEEKRKKEAKDHRNWQILIGSIAILAIVIVVGIIFVIRRKPVVKVIEIPVQPRLELVPERPKILVDPDIPTLRKAFAEEKVSEKSFIFIVPSKGTEFDGMRFDCVARNQGEKSDPQIRFKIDPSEEWVAFKNASRKAIKLVQAGLAA